MIKKTKKQKYLFCFFFSDGALEVIKNLNDIDYYDDNDDDNDDVRLNDVDDVDDVVFPFYFFFYFISEGMEWRGGGKVQDLILSIYIHRHTD